MGRLLLGGCVPIGQLVASASMRVLAGDIGGTKTALAIAEIGRGVLDVGRSGTYPSGEYESLESIVDEFLQLESARPRFAAFGVAGPVRKGQAKVTKLPWSIDERRLARAAGIRHVRVLNDFVAAALGIPYLGPRQIVRLRRGAVERGAAIALIGAGTGLGQAALVPVAGGYEPAPSEGGHADFGPRDEVEDRLVRFVRREFGRVTRDRLLSGEGLGHIYDFLASDGFARETPEVARELESGDRAAAISRFALEGTDRLCVEALRRFVSIYGSEAGNLALQYRATGGVYVAGGIAPKILPALRSPEFLKSFQSKPPMEAMLAKIPVLVVRDPRLGLFGAAAAAHRIAIETTRPSSKTMARDARR